MDQPRQLSLDEWDTRYEELQRQDIEEPPYGGPLSRHVVDGDLRLLSLKYDNSPASLDLWNFLLTEEDRLKEARTAGKKLVGTMKDLGTVPVMVYSLPNAVAFYPDGAWWIPCVMELSAGLLNVADSLGIDESFCPVRAMLGAFLTEAHFPIPDLLTCSVGATCDDFSAIAQRLEGLGYPILWWEIPHRRRPDAGEASVTLPGGYAAPREQVDFVVKELARLKVAVEELTEEMIDDERLAAGIRAANDVRTALEDLRTICFTAETAPLPALELLVAEMFAIHFCSDRTEALRVMEGLVKEARKRAAAGAGHSGNDAVRVFWVNPVADLKAMNMLEECGGRVCGTEYLFSHALDLIPTDVPPMEALAQMALADPMVGPATDRAERICADCQRFGSEAVVVSRIPGASHCAQEGRIIKEEVEQRLGLPAVEIEIPPVSDAEGSRLRARLEALVELAKERREK